MSENTTMTTRRQFFKVATSSAALAASISGSADAQTGAQPATTKSGRMIRQLWFGYLNGVDKAEGERWYYRYHAPEFMHWYGPWLRRYETYCAHDPPPEAVARFGAKPGKYTEMWWASLDDYDEAESNKPGKPYTLGAWPRSTETMLSAMTIIPARPTEDFLGKEPNHEQPILRWIRVFRYPNGVSREEGDNWYREVHAPELKQLSGLLRFVSHRTVHYRAYRTEGPWGLWHRVDELWFADLAAWRKAVIEAPPRFTPPRWASFEIEHASTCGSIRITKEADLVQVQSHYHAHRLRDVGRLAQRRRPGADQSAAANGGKPSARPGGRQTGAGNDLQGAG